MSKLWVRTGEVYVNLRMGGGECARTLTGSDGACRGNVQFAHTHTCQSPPIASRFYFVEGGGRPGVVLFGLAMLVSPVGMCVCLCVSLCACVCVCGWSLSRHSHTTHDNRHKDNSREVSRLFLFRVTFFKLFKKVGHALHRRFESFSAK